MLKLFKWDQYETDEQRTEALLEWLKDNARALIFGVVLGLGLIYGMRWWTKYQYEQQVQQANAFYILNEKVKAKDPSAAKQLEVIQQDSPQSIYVPLSGMVLASVAMENGDLAQAAQQLEMAGKNTEWATLNKIRQARVLVEEGKLTEANSLLAQVNDPVYQGLRQEIEGDIALLNQDLAAARKAYEAAKVAEIKSSLLNTKLTDLGDGKAVQGTLPNLTGLEEATAQVEAVPETPVTPTPTESAPAIPATDAPAAEAPVAEGALPGAGS